MISISIMILLFTLLGIGIPVGFAMAISGAIGLYAVGGWDVLLGVLQTSPLSTVSSYEMIVLPMFLLMAEFIVASGIANDVFRAAAAWVGHIRGGLGMATAIAGAGFGAICGTSTASAAALSATSLPAMIRQGYEPRMAAGVVSISGTLAMLIPPSVALIIYGLLAEVNIGKLLIGGLIPGLIVMVTIILTVYVLVLFNPAAAPLHKRVEWGERIRLLKVVGPLLALMTMVTAVIYTGIATPTEASALGATGGFGVLVWKCGLVPSRIYRATIRAAEGTCMIALILLSALLFGYFLTLTYITQDIVSWVNSLQFSKWAIITIILAGYILLGMFMDQIAILVLTVPVIMPVIITLGFDPIWFGVILVVTAEVGMVTPPVGLNCFIVARYANRPVSEVFYGVWPHVVAHLFVIALLIVFPWLITWLPSQMQ